MLPRELVKKIRLIEISTSRLASSHLAGHYHSVFKGSGIAFAEVRPYAAGDDVRTIDWNVSARMNELHIKVFTEERDRTVMLIIDMSASGRFGSQVQTKREVAAEVAALLAFSAIKNNDRVGLLIVTDEVERMIPPKKGRRHVLRVIREILTYEPQSPRGSLRAALEYLGKVTRRRAVAFVISDFLDADWEKPLRVAGRRHDIVPVVVTDPLEEALPALGLLMVEDLETGEVIELDTAGPESKVLAALIAGRTKRRDEAMRRLDMDVVHARTDRPFVPALVAFFRDRARRMQHGYG